jgi:hypothetical protein
VDLDDHPIADVLSPTQVARDGAAREPGDDSRIHAAPKQPDVANDLRHMRRVSTVAVHLSTR